MPTEDEECAFEDLSKNNQKLIVTNYALNHWVAQTNKLNINNLPK